VGAQRSAILGFFGSNSLISLAQSSRAARSLATSMKKFMPMAQKKRQARRKAVDIQAGRHAGAGILEPVGQRVGKLEVGRRAGFLHVVAADR
jgi:hypothetical protein